MVGSEGDARFSIYDRYAANQSGGNMAQRVWNPI